MSRIVSKCRLLQFIIFSFFTSMSCNCSAAQRINHAVTAAHKWLVKPRVSTSATARQQTGIKTWDTGLVSHSCRITANLPKTIPRVFLNICYLILMSKSNIGRTLRLYFGKKTTSVTVLLLAQQKTNPNTKK